MSKDKELIDLLTEAIWTIDNRLKEYDTSYSDSRKQAEDLLAEHDRRVAERAWDQGQASGWSYGPEATNPGADNPYRKESG